MWPPAGRRRRRTWRQRHSPGQQQPVHSFGFPLQAQVPGRRRCRVRGWKIWRTSGRKPDYQVPEAHHCANAGKRIRSLWTYPWRGFHSPRADKAAKRTHYRHHRQVPSLLRGRPQGQGGHNSGAEASQRTWVWWASQRGQIHPAFRPSTRPTRRSPITI